MIFCCNLQNFLTFKEMCACSKLTNVITSVQVLFMQITGTVYLVAVMETGLHKQNQTLRLKGRVWSFLR